MAFLLTTSYNSSNVPLGMPPPGVQANLDDPDSIAGKVHITAVICGITVALFVAMQTYTRLCINKFTGWDDCKSSLMEQS